MYKETSWVTYIYALVYVAILLFAAWTATSWRNGGWILVSRGFVHEIHQFRESHIIGITNFLDDYQVVPLDDLNTENKISRRMWGWWWLESEAHQIIDVSPICHPACFASMDATHYTRIIICVTRLRWPIRHRVSKWSRDWPVLVVWTPVKDLGPSTPVGPHKYDWPRSSRFLLFGLKNTNAFLWIRSQSCEAKDVPW